MDRRFDSTLSTSRTIDADGFLHIPMRVIGIGDLTYDDGVETVTLESVRDEEFLKSIQGKPIIRDDHSWKSPADMTGVIGNFSGIPEIKDGFVVCDAIITDRQAIDDIQSGLLIETSAGYRTEAGSDKVQRDLRCNHLVICEKGRARGGREMRVGNTIPETPKQKIKLRVNVNPDKATMPTVRENRVNVGNGRLNKIAELYLSLTRNMLEQTRHLEDLEALSLSENDRATILNARGDLAKLREYEQIGMQRFGEILRGLRRANP